MQKCLAGKKVSAQGQVATTLIPTTDGLNLTASINASHKRPPYGKVGVRQHKLSATESTGKFQEISIMLLFCFSLYDRSCTFFLLLEKKGYELFI